MIRVFAVASSNSFYEKLYSNQDWLFKVASWTREYIQDEIWVPANGHRQNTIYRIQLVKIIKSYINVYVCANIDFNYKIFDKLNKLIHIYNRYVI